MTKKDIMVSTCTDKCTSVHIHTRKHKRGSGVILSKCCQVGLPLTCSLLYALCLFLCLSLLLCVSVCHSCRLIHTRTHARTHTRRLESWSFSFKFEKAIPIGRNMHVQRTTQLAPSMFAHMHTHAHTQTPECEHPLCYRALGPVQGPGRGSNPLAEQCDHFPFLPLIQPQGLDRKRHAGQEGGLHVRETGKQAEPALKGERRPCLNGLFQRCQAQA